MELLPCPFCGSKVFEDSQFGREYWIQCSDMDCSATTGIIYDNPHAARCAWNRRSAHNAGVPTEKEGERETR